MLEAHSNPNKIKKNQWHFLIYLSVAAVLGLGLMFFLLSDHSSINSDKVEEKANFASPLSHIDNEPTLVERTQKRLVETEKQTLNLQDKVKELSQINNENSQINQKLREQNEQLLKRVEGVEKQLASGGSAAQSLEGNVGFQENLLSQPPGAPNMGQNMVAGRAIRTDVLSSGSEAIVPQTPAKTPDTYVPAGTFAKAVMIGGADASAAVNAQANPVPMLFRIIANGTLPNKKHSHLKDCVVTAAVVGDISSERGFIRLEKLSCTYPNGEVVDQGVEGTIFGTEGKNGVRGTPVWREGALLKRAFAAGALSGLSNGIAQTYTSNSISQLGTVQTVDNSKILQYGAANGVSKAMDKLADYNIQRAEQYHPVIQISAGTVVDVVFLNGFYLDGKKHQTEENTPSHLFAGNNQPTLFPEVPTTNETKTLPLTAEQVARIQEKSKELGLRVNTINSNG